MQIIMFNDKPNLTEAVINKTKTMTRRAETFCGFLPDAINIGFNRFQILNNGIIRCHNDKSNTWIGYKTKYKVGEVVAVAQSYNRISVWLENEDLQSTWYKAGKNNKMFVRPDLMPHQVKITGIKIERLQDISDEDCIKEGIYEETDYDDYDYDNTWYSYYADDAPTFGTPQEAFASLIDELKKGTWECNPWVVCYSFELIK